MFWWEVLTESFGQRFEKIKAEKICLTFNQWVVGGFKEGQRSKKLDTSICSLIVLKIQAFSRHPCLAAS